MTRIDGTSTVAALLRAQMADAQRARADDARVNQSGSHASDRRSEKGAAADSGLPVEEDLLRRIRSISADDPDRRRKAFRLFMESVMLKEFGEQLRTDPQFPALLDSVIQQMEGDPELYAASTVAMDALLTRRS